MKKSLVALSLLLTAGVTASEVAQCCPEPCAPVCCTPCCTPVPRKCINCEAYNPPFYILQCDWGFFADVEFLYWYARESELEFGFRTNNQTDTFGGVPITQPFIQKHFFTDSEWDPGVRVGLGWNMNCDGWDLYLNWTWLKTDQDGSASNNDGDNDADDQNTSQLFSEWLDLNSLKKSLELDNAVSLTGLSAKWRLTFNQVDLELGKKYWVSRCFNLRPYLGLRGAWTRTHFNVDGDFSTPSNPQQTGNASDEVVNKVWGVGILGGLQPNFRLGSFCGCGEFSIYGNLEAAAIWGRFRSEDEATFLSIDQSSNSSYHKMNAILDLAIGLRWEEYWCCDRYLTTIDLGWEHHQWWDSGLYYDKASLSDGVTSGLSTNLGYGGFVLRVRFDF